MPLYLIVKYDDLRSPDGKKIKFSLYCCAHTPDWLVTQLRTRAGAPAAAGIDPDGLLDERLRELSWAGWRRNDLIRFGKFEIDYPLPNDVLTMSKDVTRRLFPIPIMEIRLNTNLVQNEGYPKN
ncbi:RagB/SusD family nutrient uptake outer membrane protein [Flavitalea sp. BT771]|uniref:RagB/SusD family nutrient uptake outer membrane protein n=1 Tax=Flavitalea sp. BT771 TaxID=3063329 RepID=UPI0026E4948A|nr:RagB/SusD family nutrient uptake outer membrane protein [Flavitalea sp. BT771]MDO6431802.1 RagB/SusD family nutrient uptake outer membrane protein [Flavitalea sp. BT771]MDV6220711.1 RagB/SusD family nutrient uptake outer membrane protein [Flavitalea sp. BT771]